MYIIPFPNPFLLREFNNKLTNDSEKVSDTLLNAIIALTSTSPEVDTSSVEALHHLLRWPNGLSINQSII